MNSFEDLEIFRRADKLYFEAYKLAMSLPKHELYELSSQVRRSSDSIATNIVEGYGRRRYKPEFIRFLIFSHASSIELIYHLSKISKLYPMMSDKCKQLQAEYVELSKMINKFIQYVENKWKT